MAQPSASIAGGRFALTLQVQVTKMTLQYSQHLWHAKPPRHGSAATPAEEHVLATARTGSATRHMTKPEDQKHADARELYPLATGPAHCYWPAAREGSPSPTLCFPPADIVAFRPQRTSARRFARCPSWTSSPARDQQPRDQQMPQQPEVDAPAPASRPPQLQHSSMAALQQEVCIHWERSAPTYW